MNFFLTTLKESLTTYYMTIYKPIYTNYLNKSHNLLKISCD